MISATLTVTSDLDVDKLKVDVIGGHAGTTIIPLLSQVCHLTNCDEWVPRGFIHKGIGHVPLA